MKIRIDADTWRVAISEKPLGQNFVVDAENLRIEVCRSVPWKPRERKRAITAAVTSVLILGHSSVVKTMMPDIAARAMDLVSVAVDAAGGDEALMRLNKTGAGTPRPRQCRGSGAVECFICDRKIPRAQVATDGIDAGDGLATRACYCEDCDVAFTWQEGLTAKGMPDGDLIAGPVFLRREKAWEWIRNHPDHTRVRMAQ